ncbi:UNVERIFIED_CONTAM: hypothetical protein GTU68_014595 [Idotea baltica]|nr:hypothetical protein [Idotea baltica]
MKIACIVFPGTNCEHDIAYTYSSILGGDVKLVWHRDTDLGDPDLVVIPGGFSYGDYLRTGALAKISPVMEEIRTFADKGGPVIGICNGFQILCEVGLLPGVLLQNTTRKFISRFVNIRVENTETPFTSSYKLNEIITCPVSHFDGNYFADEDTVKSIEDNSQVIFRYCEICPNGSINSIAGISNEKGNILGMMPHPERSIEDITCNNYIQNSLKVFSSLSL